MTTVLWRQALWRGVMVGALASLAFGAQAADTLVRLSNGETITNEDLANYVERRIDLRGSVRNASSTESVLRDMAMTRALVLEGERLKEPRGQGKEAERFDDVYALGIFGKLRPQCEAPADAAAARKYYDEHPEAFRTPTMVRVSRVMLPLADTVEAAPAAAWMATQAMAIASGAVSFEAVAEKASAAYGLEVQGDLGWVALTGEGVVFRVLNSAKQGELVGPVRDGDFSYLFYVAAKREAQPLAWEQVATGVAKRAVAYCREQGNAQVRSDLFAKYGVVLDQEAIKGLFQKAEKK